MTEDVCDECWGSGSRFRKAADLRELSAIARSPEPAAEPRYTLADAMDVLGRAIMDLANEAEILRTQHVDNLRALDSGRRIQKIVDALARLRSGGATTESEET
jgi:hypothetical protein